MTGWEIFEVWVIAFFTLSLFSFMYKDNPLYKVAEHIFAGLSAGYYVGLIWDTVIVTQLWDPMIYGEWLLRIPWTDIAWDPPGGKLLLIIPGILGFLMFARFFPRYSWVSRTSLAFVMGITAGIFITSQLHGLVLPHMQATMRPANTKMAEVKGSYETNQAEFLIIDEADTISTVVDSAATVTIVGDSAAVDSVQVQEATPPTPVMLTDNGILMDPGAIRVEPLSVVWGDEATTYIYADFRDTSELRFGDFYSATVKIRSDSSEIKIADNEWDGWNGMEFVHLGGGQYRMEYEFEPQARHVPGSYEVLVEIKRNETLFILTVIVVIGVLATLIYFYFSKEHVGVLGVTARVGIWFIMISFGAHFGYTVMGRVSLLIGRVQFLAEDWMGTFSHLF